VKERASILTCLIIASAAMGVRAQNPANSSPARMSE